MRRQIGSAGKPAADKLLFGFADQFFNFGMPFPVGVFDKNQPGNFFILSTLVFVLGE